jgi:hypothetical protein
MSAESSGVFTLKEINRIKIIQDVLNVCIGNAMAESTSVSAMGNAATSCPLP